MSLQNLSSCNFNLFWRKRNPPDSLNMSAKTHLCKTISGKIGRCLNFVVLYAQSSFDGVPARRLARRTCMACLSSRFTHDTLPRAPSSGIEDCLEAGSRKLCQKSLGKMATTCQLPQPVAHCHLPIATACCRLLPLPPAVAHLTCQLPQPVAHCRLPVADCLLHHHQGTPFLKRHHPPSLQCR